MFGKHKFQIMNNAIDAKNFIYNEEVRKQKRAELKVEDKFVIGHVGRFNLQKNHEFLVKCFADFAKTNDDAVLVLIGNGEMQEKIKKMAKEYGIETKVKFLGLREDIPQLLQDVYKRQVVDGLVVYPKVIESRLRSELPFMATENIMMDAVKAGGDRQELHEKIRVHSMAAGKVVKEDGKANDLLERIAADPAFGMNMEQLQAIMKPENFVGRAPQQTEEFVNEVINPILEENKEVLGLTAEINV